MICWMPRKFSADPDWKLILDFWGSVVSWTLIAGGLGMIIGYVMCALERGSIQKVLR